VYILLICYIIKALFHQLLIDLMIVMKIPDLHRYYVASVTFKEVGVSNLAKYFFHDVRDVMLKLKDMGLQNVVLETCNRVEIYCYGGNPIDALKRLGLNDSFIEAARLYKGLDVFRHLIHVVSGLDSLAIGEQQIMGQARKVFNEAKVLNCIDSELDLLFSEAFKIGRRVRSKIMFKVFDYAYATLDIVSKHALGKRVLIIGTGKMANDVLGLMLKKFGSSWDIYVAGRSKLELIMSRYGVRTIHLTRLHEHIHKFDVIITCVSSNGPIIDSRHRNRLKKGVVIIDLGIPANVELKSDDYVLVYNFEDVSSYIRDKYSRDSSKIDLLYEYIEEELRKLEKRFRRCWINEVSRLIYTRAEDIRRIELEEAYRELLKLVDDDVVRERIYRLMDVLTWSLIKRIYHQHIEVFRRLGESIEDERELLSILVSCFRGDGADANKDRGAWK